MISHPTVLAAAWLAVDQPAAAGTDWISYLLNGGPFAVVLLLVLLDKLGTNSERDRLRLENAALLEKNDKLNDTFRTEIVPPLLDQNRLMKDVVEILDDEDRFPKRRPSSRRSS